jgi:hypothetical protein
MSLDAFVLNGNDDWVLIVRGDRVVGYCGQYEIWDDDAVLSHSGLSTVFMLGLAPRHDVETEPVKTEAALIISSSTG